MTSAIVVSALAHAETADEIITVTAVAPEDSTDYLQGYVATKNLSATKTDTPIIRTPQSVSVVTADEMKARQTDTFADAFKYTPGFIAQPNGFSRLADDYTIRGFNVGSGTGGILKDGMKMQASVYDGGLDPYAFERLEMIKGAASVLYGQLSPGGLINAVTKRPTSMPWHELNLEYGSFDRKQISGDFSGPIDDEGKYSYRLTGLLRDSDTQTDYINDDKQYLAPAFTWRPNDDTSLTLLASYQKIKTKFATPLDYNMTTYSKTPGTKIQRDQFVGEPDFDQFNTEMKSVSYLFTHQFSDTMKMSHALRYMDAEGDFDYMNAYAIRGNTLTRYYSKRHEHSTGLTTDSNLTWTLGSGNWEHQVMVGTDYYHKTYDSARYIGLGSSLDLTQIQYGNIPVVSASDSGSRLTSDQLGVYLQDQITWDNKWVLLLSGRNDWSQSRTTQHANQIKTIQSDHKPTGRIGAVYLADHGLAPFVSYSQSFNPSSGIDREGNSFKPTEGEQYEAGIRFQPPQSKTMLSVAVYQLTQTNALTTDPVDSSYNVQTGEVRSRGLEFEVKSEVTSNLNVITSYAYTDARVTKDNDPVKQGSRVEGVPYHTASIWSDYRLTSIGLPKVTLGAGARYMGTTKTSPSISNDKIPAYTLFDTKVSYQPVTNLTVSLKVQNLTNEKYLFCNTVCRYGDERSAIGGISYQW
ncbi:TonB-dependent siderophore receptor [Acerihabitans sp. TG2]|uniref:TonB-dependent siderophore receptor n=1 Tax=Acerihabitans sp. TG2 TaxID=3096008 RepID=UPI002B22D488|nr:TonB-dependent siderophore receptor [Acerihabitans sp. TG2]MEA9390261.1 TonB-dependent siderophore receptor [Acerihabitans sp. TG2]